MNTSTELFSGYQPRHLWAKIQRFGYLFFPHHPGEKPRVAPKHCFGPTGTLKRQSRTANTNFSSCTVNTGCGDKCISLLAGLNAAWLSHYKNLHSRAAAGGRRSTPVSGDTTARYSVLQGTRSGSVDKNTWTAYVTHGEAHFTHFQCQDTESMPFVWMSRLPKVCCNATIGRPHHVRKSYRISECR